MRLTPTPTLVNRYLALIAEIVDEREKQAHALALAEALIEHDKDQALAIAHMVYQADLGSTRALDVMIDVMTAKGRLGKAEVLRNERAKLGARKTTEVLPGNPPAAASPSLSSQPPPKLVLLTNRGTPAATLADLGLQHPTIRLDQAPVSRSDVGNSPAPEYTGLRELDFATTPLTGATLDLGTLVEPKSNLPAKGSALPDGVQNDNPQARVILPAGDLAAWGSELANSAAFAEPPLPAETDALSEGAPIASQTGATPSPDALLASGIAAHSLPSSGPAFGGEIRSRMRQFERQSSAVVDSLLINRTSTAARSSAHATGKILDESVAVHVENAIAALPQDLSPAQRTAYVWDLVQSLWGEAADASCAKVLESQGLATIDPGFFGLYLDALLACGAARRALVCLRRTLHLHPHLAWANAAYRRLPHLYARLGYQIVLWHEDEGVLALQEKLARRPEVLLRRLV